ncbi:MAG: peptidylprolyl isomerase, partial [Patescibacteria group bacterium]
MKKILKSFLTSKVFIILFFALILGYISAPAEYQLIPGTPDAIKNLKINLGLDLQGGSQLDYKVDLRKVPEADQAQIVEGVREVINRRVNSLGVSEPNIYISSIADETHIIVELAGIKDLNEAKAIVGKTIQLEFKEEKTGFDPGEKAQYKTQAEDILLVAQKAEDFNMLGQEEQMANPGQVTFEESDFKFKDEIISSGIADELFSGTPGAVIPHVVDGSNGYAYDQATGQLKPLEGFFILKLLEREEDAEKEVKHEKSVDASHLLVAYAGAERSSEEVTRSKDEAETRAQEALTKALENPAGFAELAKEYSDEPGVNESGGHLTSPVVQNGSYAIPFTEGALKIENNGEVLGEVVETEFGYHVIKAESVTPESTETIKEPKVKFEQIFVSAEPDPWKDTGLTGEHFVHADVQFDELLQPYVSIVFNNE